MGYAMTGIEVAITTWNRRDTVVRSVDSALAQAREDTRIVVYDNASTDGTTELLRDRYGEAITVRRWEENRGRHRNMSRPWEESDADRLVMLFDDEELLPGALDELSRALDEHPEAAFAFGRHTLRDGSGRVALESALMAPPWFRPPAIEDGLDFIRAVFTRGGYVWICAVMFNLTKVRQERVREQDNPTDDTALLLRCALRGPVAHVDRAVVTKTDGNAGESAREGLVVEDGLGIAGNSMTVPGLVGYRMSLQRFLLNEGSTAFDNREARELARAHDLLVSGLAGERLGTVVRHVGVRQARAELEQTLTWVTRWRSRARVMRWAARAALGRS